MRIALLADIHGNSIALDAVLADIQASGGVDAFWVLGDLTALGHDPVGVLQRVSTLSNVQIIRGNADDYVVTGNRPPPSLTQVETDIHKLPTLVDVSATFAWTLGMVTAGGWLEWLRQLPVEIYQQLPNGTQILCVHAAPGTEHGWGILPDMPDADVIDVLRLPQAAASLICVGHTHYVIDRRVGRWHIVNPGSISNPRYLDLRARYAILHADQQGYHVEMRAVEYDRVAVIKALEEIGHPARQYIIHLLQKGSGDTYYPLRQLQFHPVERAHVELMTSWRYPPPYDLYNLNHPPSEKEIADWLDPTINYHALVNGDSEMLAFVTFGPDGQVGGGDYSADALDIGMGVRPDLTGQGLGRRFAQSAIEFAIANYQPRALRVTIAAFNQRAIRVWENLGFQRVQQFASRFNQREFITFVRKT